MGARLIRHPWHDDFAEARNVSLEAARGDWILVMDGDEALSPRDYPAFQKVLDDVVYPGAFTMVTRNYTNLATLEEFAPLDGSYPEEEAGAGWTPSAKVRLFSNHHGIRFEGVVHEMVEGAIARLGLSLQEHPVPVHHYGGLEKKRLDRKRLLYYALGRQKLAAGSQDTKALYELAVQAGELERFDEAETLWLELLESEHELPVAWFNLGYVYLRLGRVKDALIATERALMLKPDYPAALVNRVLCRFCMLPLRDGIAVVEALGGAYADDQSIQVLRLVAMCLNGRLEEGITGLRTLVGHGYGLANYLNTMALLLRSAGKSGEAEILEALVRVFA
jgi:tetratricopeptide (TPR) repeat protein